MSEQANGEGYQMHRNIPQEVAHWKSMRQRSEMRVVHHPESLGTEACQSTRKAPPFVDLEKGRYCNVNSGIALPRRVDIAMGLQANLRIQSYGWNAGIRTEPFSTVQAAVCRYLKYSEMMVFSELYFDVIDPVFHFIDRQRYFDRCSVLWSSGSSVLEDFEALISGVVCLGSFFSHTPSPLEATLFEHAKLVLDRGSAYGPSTLSLDQVAGWILRTLYLRLTTRSHPAWFSSCATMHIAEAMALHADLNYISSTGVYPPLQNPEFLESRRNLFSCACFLNALISADAGRSKVTLLDVASLRDVTGSWMLEMTNLLWELEASVSNECRLKRLKLLSNLESSEPTLVLLRTDVTVHLFRKQVGLCHPRMDEEEVGIMLELIREGFSAARTLVSLRRPWWNVFYTPFQSLVVLLAIDTDDSLAMVQSALSVLRAASQTFPTSLAEEVIQAAQKLVAGSKRRKSNQLRSLCFDDDCNGVGPEASSTTDQDSLQGGQVDLMIEDWFSSEVEWSSLVDSHFAATQNQKENLFGFP